MSRFGKDEVLKGGDAAGASRALLDFIDGHRFLMRCQRHGEFMQRKPIVMGEKQCPKCLNTTSSGEEED